MVTKSFTSGAGIFLALAWAAGAWADPLRICADPNNLPFSNEAREGFENKVAELVGQKLGRELAWLWVTQRRGFLRETLRAGQCDLVPGAMMGTPAVAMTTPYYRSAFVFVTREGLNPVESYDDPRLKTLRIGVHLTVEGATPPALALSKRGIIQNVNGYSIWGNQGVPNPSLAPLRDLVDGKLDVVAIWGPFGGWYTKTQAQNLKMRVIKSDRGDADISFGIGMATRKGTPDLHAAVQNALNEEQPRINEVLKSFGLPLVEGKSGEKR